MSRGWKLSRSEIRHEEQRSNEQRRRIHETWKRRGESREAWDEWERACQEWHETPMRCFYLWDIEARGQMRRGERGALEDALLFLEVDPWFFRSGYLKERVLRHIKGAPLSERDAERLRKVVEMVARGRNRRELRDYWRLALVVWTPEWEQRLRQEAECAAAQDIPAPGGNKLKYLLGFLSSHRDKLRREA
jgi:hypothetical protein